MRLRDEVAIVTGASRGIGAAIAQALANEGANVVLSDIRDTADAETAVRATGVGALSIRADVSVRADVEHLIAGAVERFGRLDILVNNAGVLGENLGAGDPCEAFLQTSQADWERTIAVNLTGPFICSQAAARQMIGRRRGRIVNIASIAGAEALRSANLGPAYCTSKAGVIMLTRALSVALGPYGITVNAVGPGVIPTPMTEAALNDPVEADRRLHNIPLGRFGAPEDIAQAVVYLASPQASYVNGHTLFVDAGWLA